MSIDTAEKRRSVIDFGKIRGTGMPIPSGTIGILPRGHILNLYAGITPQASAFVLWRNRALTTQTYRNRVAAVSSWRSRGAPSSAWRTRRESED